MSISLPDRANAVLITWTSPGLGTEFAGVNVYRQPVQFPAAPLELAGTIRVPPGRDPAVVEAQHRWWADYELGLANERFGGHWGEGWNHYVSYLNRNGIESALTLASSGVLLFAAGHELWFVSNVRPQLNIPVELYDTWSLQRADRAIEWELAGRDYSVTRTKKAKPAEHVEATASYFDSTGYEQASSLEAIEASGTQMAVLHENGDRLLGTVSLPGYSDAGSEFGISFRITRTSGLSVPADYNLPPGIVLDGTDDCITTPDSDLLDPASGAFTFFFAGAGLTSGASDYLLSKGVVASGEGYAIRTTASDYALEVVVSGASATATITLTDQYDLFNQFATSPEGHVVSVSHDPSAGTVIVYVDGLEAGRATGLTLGAVANALKLIAGANNDGADAGAAGTFASGVYHSHGVYARALTDHEHLRLAGYLRGHPRVRAPGNVGPFYDARNRVCFSGVDTTMRDQSGNHLDATLVGSPVTRGIPWTFPSA